MLGSKCVSIFAALVAMAAYGADAGALPSGVCYSAWHHGNVNSEVVQKDLSQIKQYFSSIRTFHASFAGVNVIDSAAAAGLKVAVGIMMNDKKEDIAGEIKAACEGAKRHPSAVNAIYVGNENLQNGGHGKFSAGELVGYINEIKGCTTGTGIKVGSVQRINEWISAPGAAELAGASDTIGVNIYPFFTPGSQKPIEKLKAQWTQMTSKFSEDKLALTETGWPRQGETTSGNQPSKESMQSYLNDFGEWSKSHPNAYFFMMYDPPVSYSGMEYEKYFGLADKSGVLQVSIPGGSGAAPAPAPAPEPTTSAPAPAPEPTTSAPAPGPEPTTSAPAPGPAPTSATPVVTPAAPGKPSSPATTAPAPASPTSAPGGKPVSPASPATPKPASSDAEVGKDATPAPKPADASSGDKKKKKKTSCH